MYYVQPYSTRIQIDVDNQWNKYYIPQVECTNKPDGDKYNTDPHRQFYRIFESTDGILGTREALEGKALVGYDFSLESAQRIIDKMRLQEPSIGFGIKYITYP